MAPIEDKDASPKIEDTPVVKELKEIDDQYLAIEKEYEKAVSELQKKYDEKRKPFLDERKQVLLKPRDDAAEKTDSGTPGCPGFWCKALKHHPAFEDAIQEWDEPVLEYLQDIVSSHVDDSDRNKGFKLVFQFAENPYFTNTELSVECHFEMANPYFDENEAKELKSSSIDWRPGKNVTVTKKAAKTKGGGAKKNKKKAAEKEQPQQSFFGRFMNIKEGEVDMNDVLKVLPEEAAEELEEMDEDEVCEMVLEQVCDSFNAIQENIIPFAVRWYTGEADPQDSDDDSDEDDDYDDEDDDESDDEPPPAKAKGKAKAKKSPKKSPASSPNLKPADQPKEECKQQ